MMDEVKCVMIGDSKVGKSSLIITVLSQMFPNFDARTSIDTLETVLKFKDKSVKLIVFDTGGLSDFDRMRPMFYRESDVIIICYSIDNPASLENVKSNWHKQVAHHCPGKPIILVGCKLDLRHDQGTINRLKKRKDEPLIFNDGMAMAKEIEAVNFFECSALMQQGMYVIFKETARVGMREKNKSKCSCIIL